MTSALRRAIAVLGAWLAWTLPGEIRAEDPEEASAQERPTEIEADRKPRTRTGGSAFLAGATILMASGSRIEKGNILIRESVIVGVGPEVADPGDVAVVDLEGKFVIPGIIDCHSHIAIDGGVNEMAATVTAEVRIADVIDPESVSIYRALAGGTTAANLLHGSANPIGGQNAVIRLKYGRPARELVMTEAPLGIKFALGENVVRDQGRFPSSRMGVKATFRRAFVEAEEYRRRWKEYEARSAAGEDPVPVRRDLRLEALVGVLEGRILVHCHSYRADEILGLLDVAEEFGFRVATLQHVLEGYKIADRIAAHGAGASTFSDWWAYKVEAFDAIPYNAALMHRAGVVVSLNSDSPDLIRRLHLEAAKSIRYGGLSEDEALRLVTANPARQLGIDSWVGTIEVGKRGDLAVFEGHPFSVYSRCVLTIVDGEVYFERPEGAPNAGRSFREVPPRPPAPFETSLSPGQDRYAIVGATVCPVTSSPISGGTVVVEKGRIAAVGGPELAGALDPAIPKVDATGLFLYPGFVDSGTTLGLVEIPAVQATDDSSVSGKFQPDLVADSAIHPHSTLIPVTRIAGVTTVLSSPRGGIVPGQAAAIRLDGRTAAELADLDARFLVVQFPAVPEKDDDEDSKKEKKDEKEGDESTKHEKRIEELERFFEEAKAYRDLVRLAGRSQVRAPARDTRFDAMIPTLDGERPVVIQAQSAKTIRRAIEFAHEFGLRAIVAGARDAWLVADLLAEKKIPVLFGSIYAQPSGEFDRYDSIFRAPAILAERGVDFAIQTGDASNVRNLPQHAGMAASFGLDPDRALAAITIDAARILGIDREVGSIEPGKSADLVLTTGDPLEIVTEIRLVLIRGKPIPMVSKHTELAQRFAR